MITLGGGARPVSVYEAICPRCYRHVASPTLEVVCSCGERFRVEWPVKS